MLMRGGGARRLLVVPHRKHHSEYEHNSCLERIWRFPERVPTPAAPVTSLCEPHPESVRNRQESSALGRVRSLPRREPVRPSCGHPCGERNDGCLSREQVRIPIVPAREAVGDHSIAAPCSSSDSHALNSNELVTLGNSTVDLETKRNRFSNSGKQLIKSLRLRMAAAKFGHGRNQPAVFVALDDDVELSSHGCRSTLTTHSARHYQKAIA